MIFKDVESIRVNYKKSSPLLVNLKFYNPNFHYVSIQSAAAYVYINNRYLGRLALDACFKVKRRRNVIIPLTLPFDISKEYPDIPDSIFDSTFTIRLDGTITAGKNRTCNSSDFDYEIVKHPKPKIKK
jgi:hypothetical protein